LSDAQESAELQWNIGSDMTVMVIVSLTMNFGKVRKP